MTPAFQFIAPDWMTDPSPFFRGMATAVGKALCINASSGVNVQALVYYQQ